METPKPEESLDAQKGLQAFQTVSKTIADLKAKYSNMKVNGVEDKEGYEKLKEAKSVLVSTRTSVEPIKKALTEKARKYVESVNNEAKRIVAELVAIEEPIIAEKLRIDTLIAKEKQDKINAELHEYNRRINECIANGMQYINVNVEGSQLPVAMYVIGEVRVMPAAIRSSAPEKFENFIKNVKIINEKLIKEREDQKAKEEQDRLDLIELGRQQAATAKAQAEKESALQEKEIALAEKEETINQKAEEVEVRQQEYIQTMGRTEGGGDKMPKEVLDQIRYGGEPIRSAEEAVEENTYHRSVTDKAKLDQFARYIDFNLPPMVPVVSEEWAIPVAEKMKEQFHKMSLYIQERLPKD